MKNLITVKEKKAAWKIINEMMDTANSEPLHDELERDFLSMLMITNMFQTEEQILVGKYFESSKHDPDSESGWLIKLVDNLKTAKNLKEIYGKLVGYGDLAGFICRAFFLSHFLDEEQKDIKLFNADPNSCEMNQISENVSSARDQCMQVFWVYITMLSTEIIKKDFEIAKLEGRQIVPPASKEHISECMQNMQKQYPEFCLELENSELNSL